MVTAGSSVSKAAVSKNIGYAAGAMYSVEADKSKRLIVISAVGHVTKDELKAAATDVTAISQDFAPGFCALTDFRWLESMDASGAPHIAEIMDALAVKKVGSVVRVVPDPHKDIGLNILSQFHYGPDVRIVTFETLADALEYLAEQQLPG
jgi:hypothetical protein